MPDALALDRRSNARLKYDITNHDGSMRALAEAMPRKITNAIYSMLRPIAVTAHDCRRQRYCRRDDYSTRRLLVAIFGRAARLPLTIRGRQPHRTHFDGITYSPPRLSLPRYGRHGDQTCYRNSFADDIAAG